MLAVSLPQAPRRLLTAVDLFAIPEHERYHEIIHGELVRKANPTFEHGDAQSGLVARLKGPFQRPAGGRWPGGWWLASEVEIEFSPNEVYRPDVLGWMRSRVPARPSGTPVTTRPDWICEVLSPSNAGNDLVKKLRVYHQHEVGHYWIADPGAKTLTVYRWTQPGYLAVLTAECGERVRAEPFTPLDLSVGLLFGEDPGDDE